MNHTTEEAKRFGAQAEQLSARHYKEQGYIVEAMNFRTRQGEIDVIARKGNLLVFIEVKARSQDSIATPREFVTPAKQRKIVLAAKAYLAATHSLDSFVRFDVAEVTRSGEKIALHCIENAFDAL